MSLVLEAATGALDDAELSIGDVDRFNISAGLEPISEKFGYECRAPYFWTGEKMAGPDAVIEGRRRNLRATL